MMIDKKIKRFLTYIIVLCLLIANIPSIKVYANTTQNYLINKIIDDIQQEGEKTQETIADESSKKTAGNWWLVDYDGIPRNTFHNKVQEDIKNNN